MAFDGIVTTAVTEELKEKLIGGKIDKIYQPSPDELFINIHCGREKYRLYLSANTNHAGVYLTEEKSANPQNPPGFCMLLRKHLQSARIREYARWTRSGSSRSVRMPPTSWASASSTVSSSRSWGGTAIFCWWISRAEKSRTASKEFQATSTVTVRRSPVFSMSLRPPKEKYPTSI